jgi:hypothetical protein
MQFECPLPQDLVDLLAILTREDPPGSASKRVY